MAIACESGGSSEGEIGNSASSQEQNDADKTDHEV
jgi:hypothetical protein